MAARWIIPISRTGIGATLGSVVGVLFGGLQAPTCCFACVPFALARLIGDHCFVRVVQAALSPPEVPRFRIFLKTVGTSALSFGVFLMAGSAIRCEEQQSEDGYAQPRCMPFNMQLPQVAAPTYGVGLGALWGRKGRSA